MARPSLSRPRSPKPSPGFYTVPGLRFPISFGRGLFVDRCGRKAVLLLSLRPMRTSPCFAYSVHKIGKGSLGPPSDLTRVFSLAALLSPILQRALAATALNVLLGAQAPSAADLGGWTGLFSTFALVLLIPGIGGTWEEPGWRGFALPRLQAGRSALVASLILGAVWALWHLPLLAKGQMGGWDIVIIMAWTLVLTWVYNGTGGSVLIVMLFHAMFTTVSGSFISPLAFSGADSVRQSWLLAAVWCAVAVAVVMWAGPKHLSRKLHKQEEEGGAEEPGTATPSGAVKPVPACTKGRPATACGRRGWYESAVGWDAARGTDRRSSPLF